MKKKLYFLIGIISLILGVIGIVLPLLPTTPFVLLSAFCFNRSSKKFHKFILNNKVFGQYIKDYQEKKGITLKNKIIAMVVLTSSIGYSLYKVNHIHLQIFLIFVFIGVSYHILGMKTIK